MRTDPTAVLARTTQPFLKPERDFELRGTINNVCFATGLVYFRDQWLLYHSGCDQAVAVNSFDAPPDLSRSQAHTHIRGERLSYA
jgi:predicted GH43/DUF377 family glycosyl hydrolase